MPIEVAGLKTAVAGIAARLETEHAMLTELDGKIGDGDLGITLLKAFRAMDGLKETLPSDLGLALLQMGSATSRVSSSSFGTLMATGMLAVAKALKGQQTAEWSEVSNLVRAAREAMQARGKASLGDKTMLDALVAIETATAGVDDPARLLEVSRRAVDGALQQFRSLPNKIGRARVYGEGTIGLDDPGMVAVRVMLDGL